MAHRISKQKKDIAGLNPKELSSKLRELEDHVFQLRMQFRTGQLNSTSMMKLARKEIARVKTALGSKSSVRA
ncbi:MAG: 50S ribosomal protein L29 [Proteobacteria bacterium]|jgi:large subunit ribosomal protein L29|nr:MAG: 50S ribosomal protein L29 [Pseudomonadota bacterium]